MVDKRAAGCNVCHTANTPLVQASSMNRSRLFRDPRGNEVLGLAKGIYNEPACINAKCHMHAAGNKLLGVLDVIVSLDRVKANMAEYRHSVALLTFGLLLLMALVLTSLTQTLISAPLRRLLRHTERVVEGDLDGRLEVLGSDELDQLGRSFNRMTSHLQKTQGEFRELMQGLEAKVEARTREIEGIQSRLSHSEKLAALGQLVAGIADEINNPLTGIQMYASLALEQQSLTPDLSADLQTIVTETRRCGDIVRGLLEFSRESPPHKEPTVVNRLLDQTMALLEHQTLFQNVSILRRYQEDLPECCSIRIRSSRS